MAKFKDKSKMLYACVVLSITALLIYKKSTLLKSYRSIGTQTPLKARLETRAVQTLERCLYEDSDSSDRMDIVSSYFGYASDSESFFSVSYSNNDIESCQG